MDSTLNPQTLLARRKLTRTVGQILGEQMKSYLATLTPLFRQKLLLGNHVQGAAFADHTKTADQAFRELQALYEKVAPAPPFLLTPSLASPLMQMTSTLEVTPYEYDHVAKSGAEHKKVNVTSPFKFVLTYSGYSPRRLRELLTDQGRQTGELPMFVLHYLVMHLVIDKQPGLAQIFETLHFPITTGHLEGLGGLPITFIAAAISTILPSDDLVISSTEMSGMDVFEEIVNPADVDRLADPLREKLSRAVRVNG